MSEDYAWIGGLMRENYPALGFIPITTVRDRYVARGDYALQTDERGRTVGYILHGPIAYGRLVTVPQCCIQYESRLRGYGEAAVQEVVRRALLRQASGIRVRVGLDLPALTFWQEQGFVLRDIVGGGRDHPHIARLFRPLCAPFLHAALWEAANAGKAVETVRQLVAEDVTKGAK